MANDPNSQNEELSIKIIPLNLEDNENGTMYVSAKAQDNSLKEELSIRIIPLNLKDSENGTMYVSAKAQDNPIEEEYICDSNGVDYALINDVENFEPLEIPASNQDTLSLIDILYNIETNILDSTRNNFIEPEKVSMELKDLNNIEIKLVKPTQSFIPLTMRKKVCYLEQYKRCAV